MSAHDQAVHFIRSVTVEALPPATTVTYYTHEPFPAAALADRAAVDIDVPVIKRELPVHCIRLGERVYRLAFHPDTGPLDKIVQALVDRDHALSVRVESLCVDLRSWQRRLDDFNALPWHKRVWHVLRGLHV